MDEIASLSGVSKQTIYKHFGNKEALFIDIVTAMTGATSDAVHVDAPSFTTRDDVAQYLQEYAYRQLTLVLTPRLMQLRRLVIGEVSRFPDLARVLYEGGPQRAVAALAVAIEQLAHRGLLTVEDSLVAATQFNWLIMSAPLNRAMLLGDTAIPTAQELREHAAEGVRVFLAAYGRDKLPSAPITETRAGA
jgi:AcrR family transcriptional regulator